MNTSIVIKSWNSKCWCIFNQKLLITHESLKIFIRKLDVRAIVYKLELQDNR